MKHGTFLVGALLLLAASAGAQMNPESSLPSTSSASSATFPASAPAMPSIFALATPPASGAVGAFGDAVSNSPASSSQDKQHPTVFGVFQTYDWQATVGYTYLRFYIVPHPSTVENTNGLNLGIVYYPGGKWIGADGEFIATFDSLYGHTLKLTAGMGGPRFRWAAPRGLEFWVHGLLGGSHFVPQTTYGSQGAFTYEAGGGVDIAVHHRRIAYRVQADLVGTRFFSTYQYSPKVSVGIVFKY